MGDIEREWLDARMGKDIEIRLIAVVDTRGTLLRYDDACLEVDVPDSGSQLIYRHAIMSLRAPTASGRDM